MPPRKSENAAPPESGNSPEQEAIAQKAAPSPAGPPSGGMTPAGIEPAPVDRPDADPPRETFDDGSAGVLATSVPGAAVNAGRTMPAATAPASDANPEPQDPQAAAEQRNQRRRQSALVFRGGSLYVRDDAPEDLGPALKGSAADER